MKPLTLICSLALLLSPCMAFPCTAQTDDLQQRIKTFRNSKKFQIEYDRFKDETRVSVGPFYPKHKFVEMEARFSFKGTQPTEAIMGVYFVLRSYDKDWRFLNSRTLYGIIDGERVEIGEGVRNSHIELGGNTESLRFNIPMELFKKLATAKSAEVKVSSVEFALNGEHLAAFRDLISLAQTSTP